MTHRQGVLILLILLFAITYLDRVCISVAAPRIQAELNIDPVGWGWVTGMFTLAYCLFEIPTGMMGDRIGPRRVLARIVLWWSAFTVMTGAVSNYYLLLFIRFCFGAGEAGAFPNSSVVVARWFPVTQRATISAVTLMASQIGGAMAPLLVIPIQTHYGWRATFYVFGVLGVFWAAAWYAWFRDSPAEMKGVSAAELRGVEAPMRGAGHRLPWGAALRSRSVLALMIAVACYAYVFNFYQTWFHTFLVKGRGFPESRLWMSAAPFVIAALSTMLGGVLSDYLVRRLGPKAGRRALGMGSLSAAGVFVLAAMMVRDQTPTVLFLGLTYGAITFQQAGVFGVLLDIGHNYAGAMGGLLNTAAQIGGLTGSVLYGYIVKHAGNYEAPFLPMAAALFLGAFLWTRIDASQELNSP
ncbi:MAG: MFS transporter [Bryobacterales bacterium]|nr:MFS transporter [Bryobacterales bacterium]